MLFSGGTTQQVSCGVNNKDNRATSITIVIGNWQLKNTHNVRKTN